MAIFHREEKLENASTRSTANSVIDGEPLSPNFRPRAPKWGPVVEAMLRCLLVAALVAAAAVVTLPRTTGGLAESRPSAEPLSTQWDKSSLEKSFSTYAVLFGTYESLGEYRNAAETALAKGRIASILGDQAQAVLAFETAKEIAQHHGFPELEIQAQCETALIYLNQGSLRRYLQLYGQINNLRDVESVGASGLAIALFTEAEYNYYARNIKKAIALYEQAVNTIINEGPARDVVRYKLYLGYAYLADQAYESGLTALNSALAKSIEVGDRRSQALSYIALGSVLSQLDDKRGALESYKKAEDLFPDGVDLVEKARLFNGIGKIYEDYGDAGNALSYRTKALEAFRFADHTYGQSLTLPRLGVLSYQVGNDAQAQKYFDEALQITHRTHDDFGAACVRGELGTYYFKNGEFDLALAQYKAALDYFRKTNERYLQPRIINRIAQIYIDTKRLTEADDLLETALVANQRVQNKFGEADTLYLKALVETQKDNIDAALAAISKSLELSESLSQLTSSSNLRGAYVSSVYDRHELFTNLLMRAAARNADPTLYSQALQAAERARARLMIESLALSDGNLYADAPPETVEKEKQLRVLLNARSDRLTDLLSRSADKVEIQKVDAEIAELRVDLDNIKSDLRQKSPIYSAISDPPRFNLEDFQTTVLEKADILLEYSLGQKESYLWVVEQDSFEAFILPPRHEIGDVVDALRETIDARRPRTDQSIEEHRESIVRADSSYIPLARQLSDMILGPVAHKLAGKRLIIVPDGKLNHFPISALPLPNSPQGEPILLTHEIAFEPSAQTYSLLRKVREKTSINTKNLLVFSDPVFSASDARLTNVETSENGEERRQSFRFVESLDSLSRLPGSGSEAETIAALVGGDSDVFTGFSATRERLLETNLAEYRILHFATHAWADQQRPELSGFVLSRFDKQGTQIDEMIRLHDIYAMQLSADLVVLSACQTAAGKEVKGEGVMGLNSAFLQAGARSVVASLWQVEDNATNLLMKEFYRGMADGLSASAALRQAQIALYRDPQFRSPFFWAAFTLQGDMNHRPDIGTTYSRWWVAGVPVIFLLVVFARRRFAQRKTR